LNRFFSVARYSQIITFIMICIFTIRNHNECFSGCKKITFCIFFFLIFIYFFTVEKKRKTVIGNVLPYLVFLSI